jgi:hypothetical protein
MQASALSGRSNVPENIAKSAAAEGRLKDRPLPRLLQQLYRKKFTGRFVITDQTRDESDVYMREGALVYVGRPVDTDRLDNLLVEYGLVPAEIVARASQQLAPGTRLGEVLDRMGVLDQAKLAQVLKSQLLRKLTRLFFVTDGSYAVYLDSHGYGEGADHALMRVDPRTVIYPGIRAAYDLPRVTQELSRLRGQRFRLTDVSPTFVAALGIPAQDSTVASLREGWQGLDDLDAITARPLEVRSIVLALYYCDLLEREQLADVRSDSPVPRAVHQSQSSDIGPAFKLPADSNPNLAAVPEAPPGNDAAPNTSAPLPKPSFPAPAPLHSPPSPVSVGAAVVASAVPAGPKPPPPQVRPNVAGETLSTIPAGRAPSGARLAPASPLSPGGHGPVATGAAPPIVRAPVVPVRAEVKPPSAPAPVGSPSRGATAAGGESALRATIQEMAQKFDRLNHFEALGVSQNASADEVSVAFVRAARQYHPDRLSSVGLHDLQPAAERILARINEAAMVLGNPARRAEYVSALALGPNAAQATLPTVLEAENSFLKGEVFLKKGDYGKAIECFMMATQGNPSEPQYRAYLAWARFDDPRTRKETIVRETLKVIESVVQERPRFARGHYWVGLLWKFLNEPLKAERAFREAVSIDSELIDASRELRLIEMRKNKPAAGKAGSKPEPAHGGLMGRLFKK